MIELWRGECGRYGLQDLIFACNQNQLTIDTVMLVIAVTIDRRVRQASRLHPHEEGERSDLKQGER